MDILVKELLDQAQETASLPLTNISNIEGVEIESEISQLSTQVSATKELMQTMEFLKGGKQVRCICCSRVNLIERKTTLKCLECNKKASAGIIADLIMLHMVEFLQLQNMGQKKKEI